MHIFIGYVARTLFALFVTLLLAGGGMLYWLQQEPRDISDVQSYVLEFFTKGKPLEVFAVGGSAFFDIKRQTLSMSFRQTRINYQVDDNPAVRAEIPLLSVDIPITPGELSWLKPVITLYNTKLYPPPPPQGPPLPLSAVHSTEGWYSFLRFLDQGAMTFITDIVMDKASLIEQFGTLCAQRTSIIRPVWSKENDVDMKVIPSVCIRYRTRINDKETLELTAGLEREYSIFRTGDNPHLRATWYRSPRVRAGMDITLHRASASSLKDLPYISDALDVFPFSLEYINGKLQITSGDDGRPDDVILNVEESTVAVANGNGKGKNLHVTVKDFTASCSELCTRLKISGGKTIFKEWNVDTALRADVRAGSVTLETMAQTPQILNGTMSATFSGADLADIYAVADATGYTTLRKRFSKYLLGGQLNGGTITLAFPAAIQKDTPADAVTANLKFSNAKIHAPENNITLEGIDGAMQYWDRTLTATLKGGKGNGYSLTSTDITAELYRNKVTINGIFSGNMEYLAPMVPATVKEKSNALRYLLEHGAADAFATFSIISPINSKKTPLPERDITVAATFKNTVLPSLFPRTDIIDGTFTADINAGKRVFVQGTGKTSRRTKETKLDSTPFVRLPDHLITVGNGAATVSLTLLPAMQDEKKASGITLDVDASDTEVSIALANYTKQQGIAAHFTLSGIGTPGQFNVSAMRYASLENELISDGALFSPQHARLSVPLLRMDGHHGAFVFNTSGDGNAHISVSGKKIDINHVLDGLDTFKKLPKIGSKGLDTLNINVNASSVIFKKFTVTDARGTLQCRNSYCGDMYLEANAGNGGYLTFSLRPFSGDNTKGSMKLTAEPAGAVLSVLLPTSSHVKGGKATISGLLERRKNGLYADGVFSLYNARLKKMPGLSKLFAAVSLRGVGDFLAGEDGLALDKLHAPFFYNRHLITVKDAYTSGAALGLTAGGTIDFSESFIDIKGVVVPAQGGVNKIVSEIPLIGNLLTGGKNKGILSANYTFSGPMSKPQLSINPFSLLAPGILRNIFPALSNEKPTN